MARPPKKGLDYFPFDADTFDSDAKIFMLNNRFGPLGESVYLRVVCNIFKNGYYLQLDLDTLSLFLSRTIGNQWTTVQKIKTVILYCYEIGLLEKNFIGDMVMTSFEIQKRYFKAVKRRKNKIDKFCLLTDSDFQEIEGVVSEPQTPVIVTQTPVIVTQTGQEKTKPNETKPKLNEKELGIVLSLQQKIELFQKETGKQEIGNVSEIPNFVDINTLIQKFKESPQFLMLMPNMTLEWACVEENYNKVISNHYKYKPQATVPISTNNAVKPKARIYTAEQQNALFDNIETLQV